MKIAYSPIVDQNPATSFTVQFLPESERDLATLRAVFGRGPLKVDTAIASTEFCQPFEPPDSIILTMVR